MGRRICLFGLAAVAATALTTGTAALAAVESTILDASGPTAIPGSYVVVLKDGAAAASTVTAMALAARHGVKVEHTYEAALRGFAGRMTERAARRLAADPAVRYVAQNHTVRMAADQPNPPSWGLDRIDQRNQPLDSNYHYDTTASDVHTYVIDTGIRTTHTTFGGRAVWETNTIDSVNGDCNGHGTHVAGTLGGSQYGVAKAVRLHAVKVLGCGGQGSTASVVDGIDWVTANRILPAVANMSLGTIGGTSVPIDDAVRGSIASGVTYVVAAMNDNTDACGVSPARVAEAITVNASAGNDSRASFSNYGPCTDMFAPGVDIPSAWASSDTDTNVISGTSMATPHVAGVAALHLADNPTASPAQVTSALIGNSAQNRISNAGPGSPNRLLTTAAPDLPPQPGQDTLERNEFLFQGQRLRSTDGIYQLVMQGDGNLVLYHSSGWVLWASWTQGTGATFAVLQGDGNFVLYRPNWTAVWHTWTGGTAAERLVLQNDSNLVLYGPSNQVYWCLWTC